MNSHTQPLAADGALQLLQEIVTELRRAGRPDDLWTAEKIADYLNLAVGTVRNRVLTHPTFPRAIRIPTSEGGGSRRWLSKEVRAWAIKHREAH